MNKANTIFTMSDFLTGKRFVVKLGMMRCEFTYQPFGKGKGFLKGSPENYKVLSVDKEGFCIDNNGAVYKEFRNCKLVEEDEE